MKINAPILGGQSSVDALLTLNCQLGQGHQTPKHLFNEIAYLPCARATTFLVAKFYLTIVAFVTSTVVVVVIAIAIIVFNRSNCGHRKAAQTQKD